MIIIKHQKEYRKKLSDSCLDWWTRYPHLALMGVAALLFVATAVFSSSGIDKNNNNNNNRGNRSSNGNAIKTTTTPPSSWPSSYTKQHYDDNFLDLSDKTTLDIRSCPEQDNSKDRAVLCTFAKNEEAYLDEWVDYHLALGFDTIYLYDNTDSNELSQWAPQKGCRLKVVHFPKIGKQLNAFRTCGRNIMDEEKALLADTEGGVNNNNNRTTWAAYFDLDEFLVLRKHDSVVDFCHAHGQHHGAVGVNWMIMGTAGKLIYEPFPVTKRFQYRHVNDSQDEYNNGMMKTVCIDARHADLHRMDNTHMVKLHKGYDYRDTNGKVFKGASNPNGPTDVAAFYHYQPKSFKENIGERAQGRADKGINHVSNSDWLNKAMAFDAPNGTVFDDRAWLAVKKHLPHYAAYDVLAQKNYLNHRDDHMNNKQ